ncbi:tetratricopeptide repeat protein [Filifactor alocis]|uniref:tetratricopeptide repeat protein n=1 Tax=Filifactor alocis TaxID=143361 RepID=UPI003FA11A35
MKYEPELAECLLYFGTVLLDLKKYEEAEASFHEALGLFRKLLPTSPNAYRPAMADILFNLANIYHIKGQSQKAETTYREAQNFARKSKL